MTTLTCTYHCSGCGRHFHSLAAFDMHRTGDYATSDPELRRRCLAPIEVVDKDGRMRLEALSENGECRMDAETRAPVTVWSTRKTVAQQEWLSGLRPDRLTVSEPGGRAAA